MIDYRLAFAKGGAVRSSTGERLRATTLIARALAVSMLVGLSSVSLRSQAWNGEINGNVGFNDPVGADSWEVTTTTSDWGVTQTRTTAGNANRYWLNLDVWPYQQYSITVRGLYRWGDVSSGRVADALCGTEVTGTSTDEDGQSAPNRWLQRRRLDATAVPFAFKMRFASGMALTLAPVTGTAYEDPNEGEFGCSRTHEYYGTFKEYSSYSTLVPGAVAAGRPFYLGGTESHGDVTHAVTGFTVTVSRGDGPLKIERNYRCPRRANGPPYETQTGPMETQTVGSIGALVNARLIVDARQNTHDSGEVYANERWRGTGHWGIQTCNWPDPLRKYRIIAKGVRSYDVFARTPFETTSTLSSPGFGLADAECATGWEVGPNNDAEWAQEAPELRNPQTLHIPGYYQSLGATGTMTPNGFDWFGNEFKPNRFDSNTGMRYEDRLDLQVYQGSSLSLDHRWIPLEESSGGLVERPEQKCSSIHMYELDGNGSAEGVSWQGDPESIRFRLIDLTQYIEWENCGALAVKVQPIEDPIEDFDAAPAYNCNWVPLYNTVTMKRSLDRPESPLWFYPVKMTTPRSNLTNLPRKIVWRNDTTSLDWQQIMWCIPQCSSPNTSSSDTIHTVSVNRVQRQSALTGNYSTVFERDFIGGGWVTSTSGIDSWIQDRLVFDSHPECPQDPSKCQQRGEVFEWEVPTFIDGDGFNHAATDRRFRIDYICKVLHSANGLPFTMRGSMLIVV